MRLRVFLVMLAVGLGGCATVEPHHDYQRAIGEIRSRTAIDNIYDPEADELIDAKVATLLKDGVTVDEAVGIALMNNRWFQSLFDTIGASRADVVQSGLLSNPSMSLSIRFPEGGGRSNLTVGFAQQVVELWQIPIRKKIAQADLDRTVLDVVNKALSLSALVKTEYFALAELIQAHVLAGEHLALIEKIVALAEARFEAGEVGIVDVNIARGDLLDAQIEMIRVARDRDLAQSALAQSLGLSSASAEVKPVSDSLDVPSRDLPDGSLVYLAMMQRVDTQAAASVVRGAEAEIRRQYSNIFPNVTLGLEAERPERRSTPGRNVLADTARTSVAAGSLTAPSIQSRGQRNQEQSQVIDLLLGPTLDITLPIWDQNQAQIAKAQFTATQRRREFAYLLDSVAREVNDATTNFEAAKALVTFYETQAVPHAQSTEQAARAAYAAGEEPVLVLLQAQQSLNVQRRAQALAMRDLAQAMVELERSIGGRLPLKLPADPPYNQEPPTSSGEDNEGS